LNEDRQNEETQHRKLKRCGTRVQIPPKNGG